MRIVYFSVVRYPTEKAYGVTVFYTMQALGELGHQPIVISPSNFVEFGENSAKKLVLNFLWKKINVKHSKVFFINKIIFIFKRIIAAMLSKYLIPVETEILWTRDPLIGLLTYRKIRYKCIILEVHRPLNLFEKFASKILQHKNRIILAPISVELWKHLTTSKFHFTKNEIVLSPMGVPNSFFAKTENPEASVQSDRFNIGYVGGIKTSGFDQDIFSLITCFKNINFQSSNLKFVVSIYGVE